MEILLVVIVLLALAGVGIFWLPRLRGRRVPTAPAPAVEAPPRADPIAPAAASPREEAERALDEGRFQDALGIYARSDDRSRLVGTLRNALPQWWPISGVIRDLAIELLDLEGAVGHARAAGVPEVMTDRLTREARATETILWDLTARIRAASRLQPDAPALQTALERETAKLEQLRATIGEARAGLAELALAGGNADAVGRVEARFRGIAATAKALSDDAFA